MSDGQWYWCLRHHAVEPYSGCKDAERLGPYATADEAAGALDEVSARNEQLDEQERREREEYGSGSPFGA